jgi:PhoH-like ATPase
MKKNFVLDTNVLLHDPGSLTSFEDNNVVIPIYVIEEVDSFKKDLSELGRNARQISRVLDDLRGTGRLVDGVPIDGDTGGTLRVAFAREELSPEYALASHSADNRIVSTALQVQREDPDTPCVFISKDINLRIRAAALGLEVQDYTTDQTDILELYSGVFDVSVDQTTMDALYERSEVEFPPTAQGDHYPANSFGIVTVHGSRSSALVRIHPEEGKMRVLRDGKPGAWGIRPRNKEQRFAFELLLDDSIKLVTLAGQAGTGKTLLAVAAGLEKVAEEQVYQRLLVSRPVFPLGRDIGFLPGDVQDKLRPWMQPVHDNLELLLGISREPGGKGRSSSELFDMDLVQIEPLTYIRGRSIPMQFILVDEAQNLTPHEVKTIITRVGEDTKIVLTGDPYQIDNPYVDAMSNGLVHVVHRFRGESIAGHVTLTKGERSELAERAASLL